jgi:hypothetical protein
VGAEGGIMSAMFVGICVSGFSTRGQLDAVEAFLEGKKGKGVEVSYILLLFEILKFDGEGKSDREKDELGLTRLQKFEKFLAQSLDTVRTKVAWVERDHDDLKDWLMANGYFENEM